MKKFSNSSFKFPNIELNFISCTTHFWEVKSSKNIFLTNTFFCSKINYKNIIFHRRKDGSKHMGIVQKEIIESGFCGNPKNAASYEIYELDGITEVRIFGNGGINSYKPKDYVFVDKAPWKEEEYKLEKVIIENGISSIGSEAFRGCEHLRAIYIPKTVSKYGIGEDALTGCKNLSEVHVTNVDAYARTKMGSTLPPVYRFDLYSGEELVREVHIKSAAQGLYHPALYPVFSGCRSIERITLFPGYEIKDGAFFGCERLASVTMPKSLEKIPKNAFKGCTSLKAIDFPDGLREIGESAFEECYSLEEINLKEGLERINNYAFSGCTGVKLISLPASLTRIYDYALCDCKAVEKITVADGNTRYSSAGNCLFDNEKKTVLRASSDSEIPEGTVNIGYMAFSGCKIRCVNLPDTAEAIGKGAFMDCTSLEKVTLGRAIKEIDENAFTGCTALTEIILMGDELPKIAASSFDNCPALSGFRKSDGSFVSIADVLLSSFDRLCKGGKCPANVRRVCALLRSAVSGFAFSPCSSYSFKLKKTDNVRQLVFTLTSNDGDVYPDSSMPYREWDVHRYVCTIPDDIPDSEAEEYALSHKHEWVHTKETMKSSI